MPGIDSLITFLYVADIERSALFYEGVLGLPLVMDQGDCRIYRVGEAAFIGVCQRATDRTSAGVLITLVTDEVDEWHARLAAAGTPVDQPPTKSETYPIRNAFFRDPDGHRIEVQSFDDPDWDKG
jgi:catechol 2,3-dioxygenase-like lactoylglutathione lyase family enzyme